MSKIDALIEEFLNLQNLKPQKIDSLSSLLSELKLSNFMTIKDLHSALSILENLKVKKGIGLFSSTEPLSKNLPKKLQDPSSLPESLNSLIITKGGKTEKWIKKAHVTLFNHYTKALKMSIQKDYSNYYEYSPESINDSKIFQGMEAKTQSPYKNDPGEYS